MIPRVNYNPLGIYESLDFQNHNYSYAYGQVYPFPVLKDTLLPFQIVQEENAKTVLEFKLIRVDDNSETDILAAANGGGLAVNGGDKDFNVISYPATTTLGTILEVGQYYWKLRSGTKTYYSDRFNWIGQTDDLIKIECWHGQDFYFSGGKIRYRAPYKSTFYVCSEIGKPTYPYEEEVENRDGFNFPTQQISYKLHKFVLLAPEYLIDFIRLIRLHDFVEITARGQKHSVDEFIMNDPEWQQNGDIAALTIEFKTDSVVVQNGRGLTDLDYSIVPVASACPIAIEGRYLTHEEAVNGGVTAGQYFAYMGFAGVVVQLDASTAYYNDTEASAALTEDSCYAVTVGNEYGLPKNAIRKLNPETTYNSSAEAASGGVAIDGIYYAGPVHESAVPYGTAVIRVN